MKRWQFDQLLTNSFQLWCDFIISMGRPDNEHTARLKQWQARRTMLLAEQNNRWACHLLKEEEGWVWRERDFWHHRGLLRDLGQTDSQKPALANLVLNPDTKHRMASPGTRRESRSLRQAAGLTNSPPPHPQKVLTPILQPTSGYFREAVTATMGAALSLGRQKAQISTINSQTFWVNSLPVYISTLCLHIAPIEGKRVPTQQTYHPRSGQGWMNPLVICIANEVGTLVSLFKL